MVSSVFFIKVLGNCFKNVFLKKKSVRRVDTLPSFPDMVGDAGPGRCGFGGRTDYMAPRSVSQQNIFTQDWTSPVAEKSDLFNKKIFFSERFASGLLNFVLRVENVKGREERQRCSSIPLSSRHAFGAAAELTALN